MLKLNVKVGQSVLIGGPTMLRVAEKSGQVVGLVFDADRSVPIRIVEAATDPGPSKPQGGPVGLGTEARDIPRSPGLGRK